jgi:hypothetical protein
MTENNIPDKREFFARQVDRQLGRIAGDLREYADRIERLRKDVDRIGQPGYRNAGNIAAAAYKEIVTLLLNTPVDLLITEAADYDINVTEADAV